MEVGPAPGATSTDRHQGILGQSPDPGQGRSGQEGSIAKDNEIFLTLCCAIGVIFWYNNIILKRSEPVSKEGGFEERHGIANHSYQGK